MLRVNAVTVTKRYTIQYLPLLLRQLTVFSWTVTNPVGIYPKYWDSLHTYHTYPN